MILRNLIIIFLFTSTFLFAQEDVKQKISLTDRFFTGGNIGLQVGNPTMIDGSPLIGFKLTKNAAVGVGASYLYFKYHDVVYNANYISNTYGGRAFVEYTVWRDVYLHGEYEVLNGDWGYQIGRYNMTSILIGAGYRQLISGRTYFNLAMLWNFNNTYDSPYTNPIIRCGIIIGL